MLCKAEAVKTLGQWPRYKPNLPTVFLLVYVWKRVFWNILALEHSVVIVLLFSSYSFYYFHFWGRVLVSSLPFYQRTVVMHCLDFCNELSSYQLTFSWCWCLADPSPTECFLKSVCFTSLVWTKVLFWGFPWTYLPWNTTSNFYNHRGHKRINNGLK